MNAHKEGVKLTDYFDPAERYHLNAYRELQKTGVWPAWFLRDLKEKGVVLNDGWWIMLVQKIANHYLDTV